VGAVGAAVHGYREVVHRVVGRQVGGDEVPQPHKRQHLDDNEDAIGVERKPQRGQREGRERERGGRERERGGRKGEGRGRTRRVAGIV